MSKSVALLLVLVFLTASSTLIAEPVSSNEMKENSWTTKAPMQQARGGLGVAVVNGKIYAIGGSTMAGSYPYNGGIVGTNEEYAPATNTWSFKKPMPTPRMDFGIAVYNNKIYCMNDDVNQVYDPAIDTWENRTPMPTPRHRLEANVVDGKIYLIGGYDSSLPYGGDATDINEVYDPETDTWSTKAPMLAKKCDYASAVVGDKIHIIGGYSIVGNKEWNLHQIYDTKTDSWSYGTRPPSNVIGEAGVTTGVNAPKRIYVFGGGKTQVYDPGSDSWTVGADIPTDRAGFAVAVLDDLLYVIGGGTADGIPFSADPPYLKKYATNEQYTPFGYGTIPLEIVVVSPENKTYASSNVSLVFTVNKPTSWLGYRLDGQEPVTVAGNTTITMLPNGLHNVTSYAKDMFENTGVSETIIFTISVEPKLPPAEPFLTTLIVASVIAATIVGLGLVVYFKRRKR